MKKFSIILISLWSLCTWTAEGKSGDELLKAEYLYRNLSFHEAIPYYEKAAEFSTDPGVFMRLADCYRLTKDLSRSASWYSKAVQYRDCPVEAFLHYGQVLMSLGQYDQASRQLRQYQQHHPEDVRVSNLIESCRFAPELLSGIPSGYVRFLRFNTDGSDFGPALHRGSLVFTTDSVVETGGFLKPRQQINSWSGQPFYNLYQVDCDSLYECSGEIRRLAANINTRYHDGPAFFHGENGDMYFTRTNFVERFLSRGSLPDQNGTVHLQIMKAEGYDEQKGKYSRVRPFAYNSRTYSTAHPTISPSGRTMVFVSDMPGGKGGNDLYICTGDGSGSWSAPQNLSQLNTEGDEMFPVLVDDETLYFSSNGHIGLGGLDIYRSHREGEDFGAPVHMGIPLNSGYDDMSLTLIPGTSSGYFSSNRPASRKSDNIYYVNLQRLYLSVKVIDDETGAAVTAAQVKLTSPQDSRDLITASHGGVVAPLHPQMNYEVEVSKAGYKPTRLKLSTVDIWESDTLHYEVHVVPDFHVPYSVVVLNEQTGAPIERPTLVISLLGGENHTDTIALNTGERYTASLKPESEYNIFAIKENYYGSEKFVATRGVAGHIGDASIEDTIYLKELRVGEVYKIDNIYYDYDKANIREDAKPSLNALLKLLDQYPNMVIQINSHTDCRGRDAYNMNLSKARAASVIKYLNERGISRSRLSSKGFGETMPVEVCEPCDACSEQSHQLNRRTEFQIQSM